MFIAKQPLKTTLEHIEQLMTQHQSELSRLKQQKVPKKLANKTVLAMQHSQTLAGCLKKMHTADIADLLETSPAKERHYLWQLLSVKKAAKVLLEVTPYLRQGLLNRLSSQRLKAISQYLDSDELVDITQYLPDEILTPIISNLDDNARQEFEAASQYAEGLVGAVMDFEQISVRDDVACKVVYRYLQRFKALPANTNQIFIVNAANELVGILPLRTLLVQKPDTAVKDIMLTTFHHFNAEEAVVDVAGAFERYDLVTAAVVDQQKRLIGRLTISDMVDVIRSANEAEIFSMAGFSRVQGVFSPLMTAFKSRWLWLAINLCTAFFASRIIGIFEGSIEKIVALASLMPIIAGIGGNAGNQTITMIVRAMAQHRFTGKQIRNLWFNESLIALANGVIWGGLLGLITAWIYDFTQLGMVMMLAMILNLLLAASMGVLIPYFMQRTGRDPALGSSVLITACTDSGGFFIFLGLANILLL